MIDENGILDLTGLKEVNIEDYSDNKKLKKLIIGNTFEEIREGAFYECSNLEEIDFSNTILKEISEQCFAFCSSLKSIHLPSTIKPIGALAFANCTNLETVILDGINQIKRNAFCGCHNLKEFVFYEDIEEDLEENNIFDGISENQKIKITCPEKCVNYFKNLFPKSEINENSYVLK